ncbi:MAG: M20 family metallopeptidase [Chloroflexota bacterium]|nr:M20 family metallopeptidase [Chloroflexota bacterium]
MPSHAMMTWLDSQLPRFLDDLRTFTAIDSGTYNPDGVNTIGSLMARRLTALGCTINRYPCRDQRLGDSVIGTLRGTGRARILLSGHMDTVYPQGTAASRPLVIEEGQAIGPGTCDMKGGLLAGLYALEALQLEGFSNFAEIIFFCNSDEEINSPCSEPGYLPLVRMADAALVLEAGWPMAPLPYGALTVARKAGGRFRLQITGIEAHAGSEFERGASATLALARKIDDLARLTGRWPGVTVNVGVIHGGVTHNTVAGNAYAEVDVRVGRAEDVPEVEQAIRAIAERCDVGGTQGQLEGAFMMPAMEPVASAWLAALAHREAAALGFSLSEFVSGGTSDASYMAAAGAPVLDGLGPVGAKDHSPAEYLLVDSIVPRTALLARLIMAIARETQH